MRDESSKQMMVTLGSTEATPSTAPAAPVSTG
jgi:hypothetical protein